MSLRRTGVYPRRAKSCTRMVYIGAWECWMWLWHVCERRWLSGYWSGARRTYNANYRRTRGASSSSPIAPCLSCQFNSPTFASPRLHYRPPNQQPSTVSLSTLSSFILADFFTYEHWHFQSMVVEGQSSVGVQITGALPVPVTPVWTLDGGRL